MVEQAEHEPTMAEIVVALRETRRDAGRVPPFTVVGGQPGTSRASGAVVHGNGNGSGMSRHHGEAAITRPDADAADIANLRSDEIERLLAENARLNERVVYLLNVIARDQSRNADEPLAQGGLDAVAQEVKKAMEVALRPVLQVFLHLLEKQHTDAAATSPVMVPAAAAMSSPAVRTSAVTSASPDAAVRAASAMRPDAAVQVASAARPDAAVATARPARAAIQVPVNAGDLAAAGAVAAAVLASAGGSAAAYKLPPGVVQLPLSRLAPSVAGNLVAVTAPEPNAARSGGQRPIAAASAKGGATRDRRRER